MQTGMRFHYQPRPVTDLGVWTVGPVRFKIWGLSAAGRDMADGDLACAQDFLTGEVQPAVAAQGDSDDLGFVIVHPGSAGLSIAAHWWVQGSVLCQRLFRKEYDAAQPVDTTARAVVACVWELAIINAEQLAWRQTMMVARPDPEAYLAARAGVTSV